MNSICIMGRLTRDPELRNTAGGIEVVNFTVAVDRKYSKSGEDKKADFISCQAWRQTAVFIDKYFRKGKMIAVGGSLRVDEYVDRDGNKRYSTYINVDNVDFCGDKSSDQGRGDYDGIGQAVAPPYDQPAPGIPDYDPFDDDEPTL